MRRVKIEDIVAYNKYTKQFAKVERLDDEYVKTKGAGLWPREESIIILSDQLKRLNEYDNIHSSWTHPTDACILNVLLGISEEDYYKNQKAGMEEWKEELKKIK